jgi:lipid A disaccharide synthetase
MSKKLFFFAGEASGDQHASVMIRKIKESEPDTEIVCWGGDLMQAAGATLLSHYRDRNVMGLIEVLKNLGTIRRFMHQAREDILSHRPDKVVFVDNPGFNLPLAKYAHSLGIFVHWYIAPKAWAWNEGRIKTMRKVIDQLDVIFPFEVEFFTTRGMPCTYVGNPTLEFIQGFRGAGTGSRGSGFGDRGAGFGRRESGHGSQVSGTGDRVSDGGFQDADHGPPTTDHGLPTTDHGLPTTDHGLQTTDHGLPTTDHGLQTIALLPGSRPNEVQHLLPIFVKTAQNYSPGARIVIAGAPSLSEDFYQNILTDHHLKADILFQSTHQILHEASISGGYALVASGTATLETALHRVPQIVAYRVHPVTYWVGKSFLGIKHVSLVNILLKRELLEEHLQNLTISTLSAALDRLSKNRTQILSGYDELEELLVFSP